MRFCNVAAGERRRRWQVNIYNVYALASGQYEFRVQSVLISLGALQTERLSVVGGQASMGAIWSSLFKDMVPRDSRHLGLSGHPRFLDAEYVQVFQLQ